MRQLINKIALNNFDRIDGKMESDDVGLGLVSGRHHTLHHQSWFPQNHSRSSSASFPIWCSSLSWVEILITQEKENKTFAQKKRLGPKQVIWLSFGLKRWKMKWSLLQEHWSNKNSKNPENIIFQSIWIFAVNGHLWLVHHETERLNFDHSK
jgi:hypothetical protein